MENTQIYSLRYTNILQHYVDEKLQVNGHNIKYRLTANLQWVYLR